MVLDLKNFPGVIPLKLVKREDWGALPAKCEETFKEYPIQWMVVTFTESEECFSREECTKVLQDLQRRQMEAGRPDIIYNFMVGGDWTVYEGRGWKYVPDNPPVEDLRGEYLEISYIGAPPHLGQRNYPSLETKHAKERIMEFGIRHGYLASNYNHGNAKCNFNAPLSRPLGDASWK